MLLHGGGARYSGGRTILLDATLFLLSYARGKSALPLPFPPFAYPIRAVY